MNNPIISINNVSFSYGVTPTLKDVTLKIASKERIAIIGPNGGGKTTLLKLIMGFLKPSIGEILLFASPPKKERDKIGYVPQRLHFDPEFPISVLEVVMQGGLEHLKWFGTFPAKIKKRAIESLDQVGLLDFKEKSFGTLSGGQMQRVLIARAIMNDPEILILDEATAGIDPEAEKKIFDLLKTIGKDKTIVMVTHKLSDVIKEIDKVYCVEQNVTSFLPEELCKHFLRGLYHTPVIMEETLGE